VEASGFRDAYGDFQKLKVPVVGVSPDTPAAQEKFKKKYSLPFTLLCDVDRKVAQAYGVLQEKNMYGKKSLGIERTTFLMDAAGKIQKIFPKVKADGHAAEVLATLKT
jgi:peroxiredoxin Q/BCP